MVLRVCAQLLKFICAEIPLYAKDLLCSMVRVRPCVVWTINCTLQPLTWINWIIQCLDPNPPKKRHISKLELQIVQFIVTHVSPLILRVTYKASNLSSSNATTAMNVNARLLSLSQPKSPSHHSISSTSSWVPSPAQLFGKEERYHTLFILGKCLKGIKGSKEDFVTLILLLMCTS